MTQTAYKCPCGPLSVLGCTYPDCQHGKKNPPIYVDAPFQPNQLGWRCPGCGACYAPFVPQCMHCTPTVKTNSTTGT